MSPCRSKPSMEALELITSPVPQMCMTESLALPSRLANHMHWVAPTELCGLLKKEGICGDVLRNFPYFSRAKHFKGAGDTFGNLTCSLAVYIPVFPDQGSLTKVQGFVSPLRLYLNTRRLRLSGERVQAFIRFSNRSEGEEALS